MRRRYRYDKQTKRVVPLEQWLAKYGSPKVQAHQVFASHFEPYKPVTGDKQGEWITTRREHQEFLRRNDLIEVGNEHDYMTRHGGMSSDNPNLVDDRRYEEQICQDLVKNLERLRSR